MFFLVKQVIKDVLALPVTFNYQKKGPFEADGDFPNGCQVDGQDSVRGLFAEVETCLCIIGWMWISRLSGL